MTKTSCLVGNGLSIAYNGDLSIPGLTSQLIDKFAASGDVVLAALASAVQDEDKGFEELVGPFDSAAKTLASLPGFESLARMEGIDDKIRATLAQTHELLAAIYRSGVSIVLELIASLGRARDDAAHDDVVVRFCQELVKLGEPGDLSVATLSYDGLLHSGFLQQVPVDANDPWNLKTAAVGPIADLADGRWGSAAQHAILPNAGSFIGHPIRSVDDLLRERIAILQIHGSLAWLRNPNDPSAIWRFELDDLRSIKYWDRWREGDTAWEPVVVLTDQKGRTVSEWPFDLGYASFTRRLVDADRWLIAGYSLGDDPVNNAFRQALEIRRRQRPERRDPVLLVIDRGDDIDARRDAVVKAIGIRPDAVIVNLDGIPVAIDSDEWHTWVS